MSDTELITAWVEATCVTPKGELPAAFVHVNPELAVALESAHSRRFEAVARDTANGPEQFTDDLPKTELDQALDERGLIRVGTRVGPGAVLIGKVSPTGGGPVSPEEKLLHALFGEKASEVRDSSLRCPPGCAGTVEHVALLDAAGPGELARAAVVIAWEGPLAVGDTLQVEGAGAVQELTVAGITTLGEGPLLAWAGRAGVEVSRVAKISRVADLIHARSIGPYSPLTQQPLDGREQLGGQRLDPRLAAALAARAPWAAWEMFTIKSDSARGRVRAYEALVKREPIALPGHASESPASGDAADDDGIFSFFERAAVEVEPGDVPAELPEAVHRLSAELLALGLAVRFTAGEIAVSLPSADAIRARSSREVLRPDTVNAKTGMTDRDGLFCQRIFGPVKDYSCICGKYARMKHRGVTCEKCGVEVLPSKVRRERFGHVELASPVVHPLFKTAVAQLLQISPARLDEIVVGHAGYDSQGRLRDTSDCDALETGAAAIKTALEAIEIDALAQVEDPDLRRLARSLAARAIAPHQLMIEVLPVLPPDLRPLAALDGGCGPTSDLTDLNDLYRRVINRNNRLRRLLELNAPAIILNNETAQLQRVVEQLFDNEGSAKPMRGVDRVLRSLGAVVEDHLRALVRRCVDYSAVSCLVVASDVPAGACKLPLRMATELYKPMAYGIMAARGHATTIREAKQALEQGRSEALEAVAAASAEAPVLLASAAGLAVRRVELWDEAALAVDPETARLLAEPEGATAVCVHLPLSAEAREELGDFDDLKLTEDHDPAREGDGWLAAAVFEGGGLARLRAALLGGQVERVEHPLLGATLGRGPGGAVGVAAPDLPDDDDFDF